MKIIITGGHLTPALAFIDFTNSVRNDIEFVFIGRKYLQEVEKVLAREQNEAEVRQIPFYAINAAKIHRSNPHRNIFEFTKFISSFHEAYTILRKEKPQLVVSFGGYLAFPIAVVAKVMGIPVLTHEQTTTLGLANRVLSLFVDVVAVSFPIDKKSTKIVMTGNPIRSAFLTEQAKKPHWISKLSRKPMVFITGGSQGSYVINQAVKGALEQLTQKYMVVHQCGSSGGIGYFNDLSSARGKLKALQRSRYLIQEWISEQDTAWLMQHADLVVSRAGANTIFELQISGAPSLLIPLPFSHNNEQQKNAERLVRLGSAQILQQKSLSSQVLVKDISRMYLGLKKYKNKAELNKNESIENGSENLLRECIKLITEYDKNK